VKWLSLASNKGVLVTESKPSPENVQFAVLAHLLGIFTAFLGPLIIWLTKKDSDAFIDDQAKEALNFQITISIAHLANFIAGIVLFLIWWLIGWAVSLTILGITIWWGVLAVVAANKGEKYRYPFCLRFIR
jgi:uncharacterized Tic20 family protein